MPALDATQLGKDMVGAATTVFNDKWPDIKDYAETELAKLANSLVKVADGVAKGTIKPDSAKALLNMNKNAAQTVLLAVEGMSLLLVEAALNAALDVVKNAVNTAAGVVLL